MIEFWLTLTWSLSIKERSAFFVSFYELIWTCFTSNSVSLVAKSRSCQNVELLKTSYWVKDKISQRNLLKWWNRRSSFNLHLQTSFRVSKLRSRWATIKQQRYLVFFNTHLSKIFLNLYKYLSEQMISIALNTVLVICRQKLTSLDLCNSRLLYCISKATKKMLSLSFIFRSLWLSLNTIRKVHLFDINFWRCIMLSFSNIIDECS